MNNWNQLLKQSQDGNKNSYKQFLTEVQPFVKAIIYKNLQNQDLVQDIMQEVLIAIHNSLNTYDSERSAHSWVSVIAKNKSIDYLRSKYHKQSSNVSLDDINVLELGTAEEATINYDLEKAMMKISDKQQKILSKMKIEGKTAKETAKEVKMSESAVKTSAHRAYKILKEFLEV